MRTFNPILVAPLIGVIIVVHAMISTGVATGQSAAELDFPYQAIVLHDDAAVSSGPGQAYYATEKLGQGDVVEVHREDPGGWCAIRPVEGSFSLVPESTLEIVDSGVGRVLEDGTQAWVGTKLGVVDKPMWQIKLQKDEIVEVLGQVSWPDPEGHSTIWYQISPPAGEFRWIRMSDIQLPVDVAGGDQMGPGAGSQRPTSNPPSLVRSLNEIEFGQSLSNSNRLLLNGLSAQNPIQQATMQIDQPDTSEKIDDSSMINQGWRTATRSVNGGLNGGASFQRGPGSGVASDGSYSDMTVEEFRNQPGFSLEPGGVIDDSQAIRIASADSGVPGLARNLGAARSPWGGSGNAGAATPSRSIGALELQLTNEMLKSDPSQWRLQDLEIAAKAVYRTTLNPDERRLAEQYLDKVNNCKRIQTGFQGGANPAATFTSRPPTAPVGSGVAANPNLGTELGTTYDAHGWLTELVRNGGTTRSEYALQDENGNITHHVAPAPGMNLRRYLKSRVGVIGKRGYHSELKLDHVTAHRIIELEKAKPMFTR